MSAKKEITTTRFVVKDDKSEKPWNELTPMEQRRLAYTWNSSAMSDAGYVQIHHTGHKKAIAV